ncbi:MAG: hypothetical protein JJ992_27125 [Planctomycetes bacterium]|nr:hypothetical protein [Planctomycetota bacterium]
MSEQPPTRRAVPTAMGAVIGGIVRLGDSDGGTVLGLVVTLVLYYVISVSGLVLYVWRSDRDI